MALNLAGMVASDDSAHYLWHWLNQSRSFEESLLSFEESLYLLLKCSSVAFLPQAKVPSVTRVDLHGNTKLGLSQH